MEKRSNWVRVVAGLVAAFGILGLLAMGSAPLLAHFKKVPLTDIFTEMKMGENDCLGAVLPPMAYYLVALLFMAAQYVAGLAAMFFKEWGRKLLLALVVAQILWMAGDFTFVPHPFKTSDLVLAAVSVFLLVFFLHPKVRAQFGPAKD